MQQCGAAGDLDEGASEYVDAILVAVARLTEQVENVLDLSQSEAGLLPITKEEVDLLSFLTKLVRERETAIVKAGLGLDLKGKRGRKVDVDPRQLGRAVGNLLDNAIAGTPEGGHILIEIMKQDPDSEWSADFVISDNGAGMSEEELTRAIDGGRTGDDGVHEKRTGLGIPLARQLVAAHGGILELTSEEGVGTTATIHLP